MTQHTIMENVEFVEELKGGRSDVQKPFKADLTICIMTFNDSKTISICLDRLKHQNLVANVIVYDCGSSDGTMEMLKRQIKNEIYYPMKVRLIKKNLKKIGKNGRKVMFRTETIEMTKTKYLMFLGANVLIPHHSIRVLLEELEEDERLGMIGMKYEPNVFHVQLGATILRTDLAKEIKWDKFKECTCRNAREQLVAQDYKVKNHDVITALHNFF